MSQPGKRKEVKVEAVEFMECESCRSKPGSPYLCEACIHNRTWIARLKNTIIHLKGPGGVSYEV